MTTRPARNPGFTIVEVLTVVAIIGLIAALLVPVYAMSMRSARQGECLANQSQIGKAFFLYAADHDETLPDQWAGRTKLDPSIALDTDFETYLWPYTKTHAIFRCPSDLLSQAVVLPKVTLFNSYAIAWNVEGRALSQIPASAQTVLMAENMQLGDPLSVNWLIQELGKANFVPPPDIVYVQPDFRHNEMGNYLFVDGHTKSLRGPNPPFPGYKTNADGIALCGDSDPLPR